MKKINCVTTMINTTSEIISFQIHPFSKILSFTFVHNQLSMLYEYPYEIDDNAVKKFINIRIFKNQDLYQGFLLPTDFNYHSLITVPTASLDSIINNNGIGSNLFMNIINNIENFHIFVQEIQTISEIREQKLKELV